VAAAVPRNIVIRFHLACMKPTITQGLGALTPAAWQQIYNAVGRGGAEREVDHVTMDRFSARITGSESVGNNKFAYSWRRNRQTAGGETNEWTDGVEVGGTNTETEYARAVNTYEGSNTASVAYGHAVNANGGLVNQDGFSVVAVPTGTVVIMNALRGLDGKMSFQFSAPNPITGECPTPLTAVAYDEGLYPLPS